MSVTRELSADAGSIRDQAVRSLFQMLESICEGAVIVDRDARIVWISDKYLALLSTYAWPGNVRELRNVLEQVTMLAESPRLTAPDFATILPEAAVRTVQERRGRQREQPRRLADAVAEAELSVIREALAAANGNKVTAAKLLGISRATLYEKLQFLAAGRTGR